MKSENMKSAMVTGATGFVGVHLCEELVGRGVSVTALCRAGSGAVSRLPQGVEIVYCDMDSYDTLSGVQADVFFHLAWEGATGAGRGDEELQLRNAGRTLQALKASRRLGCKRFIATGTIFEKLLPQITDFAGFRQADFYLLSKQYAHSMCAKLASKIGADFVWGTFFHPIGKYIKPEQMMAYAINGMLRGIPPEFGPAQEPYDITAVENIAYGLYLLGEKTLSRNEYYIGSGSTRRMYEYLEAAKAVLRSDVELKIGARPDDGMRFDFSWFDISPLTKDTGYAPKVTFEQAVRNCMQWIRYFH
jgi:nucleoside-diphosphate-sugar epimerase